MANPEMTAETTVKAKRVNPVAKAIDSFFHISERGTTIRSEIGAGAATFFVAVAALLLNTQVIGAFYGNYAGAYLAATLISFLGTLLLGLLFNRPLMQISNMAIASVIISMLGVYEGLSYANVMMITFIAAILYLVIVISPLGTKIVSVLPLGVRKALPVGVGLSTILMGLKNSGLITSSNTLANPASFTGLKKYIFFLLLIGIVLYIVLKAFKERKAGFRVWACLLGLMWAGGILFYMNTFVGGQTAAVIVYERLNVIIATDGASPYNIALGFSSIEWGKLFTSGFDFSAVTAAGGNPGLIVIQGILTFLALGIYGNAANLHATAASGEFLLEDQSVENERKAYLITAGLNVVAPIMGAAPTSIGAESAVSTDNEGKTGLSSVITSVGLLISMFTWAVFALTATSTNGVGMWIEHSETKLAAYVNDAFIFSDLIMVMVGASMLKGFKAVDYQKADEVIPFLATLITLAFSSNYAMAVAAGVLSDAVIHLIERKWDSFKAPSLVLDGSMLAYLIFALV